MYFQRNRAASPSEREIMVDFISYIKEPRLNLALKSW